ncbi:transporter [Bacteroidia bacterium]|nr:transporter [Bacteroidia bacterium]
MVLDDISKTLEKNFSMVADSAIARQRGLSKLTDFTNQSLDNVLKSATSFVIETSLKIILVLVIYYAGRWAIRIVKKFIRRIMTRHKVEVTLQRFVLSIVQGLLSAMLILIIVGVLGINTTSLVAIFGAAGLGIGMAMSGTLQNFAGGVMILILKPYRIGDYIEAQGQAGTVKDIRLFNTVVNTPDNKTIFIPNGAISTGVINNYTSEHARRIEWKVGIAYGDDIELAKQVIMEILQAEKRIMHDRERMVALLELADSSVKLVVRAWASADQFWNIYFDVNEAMYNALPAKGINFPFNQLDVNLKKQD